MVWDGASCSDCAERFDACSNEWFVHYILARLVDYGCSLNHKQQVMCRKNYAMVWLLIFGMQMVGIGVCLQTYSH